MAKQVGFEISVSGRRDGTLEAMYIRVGEGSVVRTEEVIEDVLLVDYGNRGKIIGIEVLGPVRLADITRLVNESKRRPLRRFVQQGAPQSLISAG